MKNFFKKRLVFILVNSILWEGTARSGIFPPQLFPSLTSIFKALRDGFADGGLFTNTWFSLYLILAGLGISLLLAVVFSTLSHISTTVRNFTETAIAVLDPLPGIALLPLAILWFGTGQGAIIFIIVHSTLWPMVLNTVTGFKTVPPIYKEVGENIGLSGPRLVFAIMMPAALPYLITGLKIGWSRAWRALIAAEMVFGTAGVYGGLGWYIYKQRYLMDVSGVFAALFVIIIIGILVEDLFFGFVEKRTIKKWGMTT